MRKYQVDQLVRVESYNMLLITSYWYWSRASEHWSTDTSIVIRLWSTRKTVTCDSHEDGQIESNRSHDETHGTDLDHHRMQRSPSRQRLKPDKDLRVPGYPGSCGWFLFCKQLHFSSCHDFSYHNIFHFNISSHISINFMVHRCS